MKPVIQDEPTGCAIASAAALAGLSYEGVRQIAGRLGISAADGSLWSDTASIRRTLATLEIKADLVETPFEDWEFVPDHALLAIKWHLEKGQPFWHWVVFVREGKNAYVLDPKKGPKSNIRTDFGRMKPKWFIAIHL